MEWIIENWAIVLGVAVVVLTGAVGLIRILKPQSPWLSVLLYILGVIEDLAPDIAKQVKGEVKAKMRSLPGKEKVALDEAVATVDPKKTTPASIKKAL